MPPEVTVTGGYGSGARVSKNNDNENFCRNSVTKCNRNRDELPSSRPFVICAQRSSPALNLAATEEATTDAKALRLSYMEQ